MYQLWNLTNSKGKLELPFGRICNKDVYSLQICWNCTYKAFQHQEDYRRSGHILDTTYTACSNFFCKRGKLLSAKHNEQFVILIRWKLIKPIIKINGKTQRYLLSIRHQQWGKKWQIWNTIPLLVDLVCEVRKKQRGKKWLIHLTILVESLCNFWFQSEGEIFGTVEKQSIPYFYREYWQSSY